MRFGKLLRPVLGLMAFSFVLGEESLAQQVDTAQLIEEARERARRIEEAKAVLNDPDPIVRLTSFDALATSGDDILRNVAIDAGLSGADAKMRERALIYALLQLTELRFTLVPDATAERTVLEASRERVSTRGSDLHVRVDRKSSNFEGGVVTIRPVDRNAPGQMTVSGTTLRFSLAGTSGVLELQDDDTISGVLRHTAQGRVTAQYKASATIR